MQIGQCAAHGIIASSRFRGMQKCMPRLRKLKHALRALIAPAPGSNSHQVVCALHCLVPQHGAPSK